jgi:predicted nucleic acid-binding protein
MTRFAIDAPVALRLVRDGLAAGEHQLVGVGALRSQVMQLLWAEVRSGALPEADARALLEALAALKVRLLADRVSRSVAWRLAGQLDWDDVRDAEPLAVASLQADVLVTDDARLAAAAEGVVERVGYAELRRALG